LTGWALNCDSLKPILPVADGQRFEVVRSEGLAVSLELEASYEETCHVLRIT